MGVGESPILRVFALLFASKILPGRKGEHRSGGNYKKVLLFFRRFSDEGYVFLKPSIELSQALFYKFYCMAHQLISSVDIKFLFYICAM